MKIRKRIRQYIQVRCSISIGEEMKRGAKIEGRTIDLTDKGALLETDLHFRLEDSPLFVTLELEDKIIELKGKVVFSDNLGDDRYKTGIEFGQMDQTTKDALMPFLFTKSWK